MLKPRMNHIYLNFDMVILLFVKLIKSELFCLFSGKFAYNTLALHFTLFLSNNI